MSPRRQDPCQSGNQLKIAPPHISIPAHGRAPDRPAEYNLLETIRLTWEPQPRDTRCEGRSSNSVPSPTCASTRPTWHPLSLY